MATYNTAFGSLPGYNEMLGTTNTTGGGQQQTYNPQQRQPRQYRQGAFGQPQQTFAQLQQQGMARPAPAAPQAQPIAQYGGSQQATQMRQRLQEQLQAFGNAPSRYDTDTFKQIRGAQSANLNAEYQAQQKALNEDLARRGLSASSIGGGRMGDLAGQQSRALADLDARLLQQAADTQAQDRAQLLAAGQGLAELAGSQDLAQFEANRVAQAAEFENQLRAAQFAQGQYEQGTGQALQAAQAQQGANQFQQELGLRLGELTGNINGQQTLAGQQQAEQRRQFDIQQALQQQLGLGNLSLEQQRVANQAQQFGLSLNEQQQARLQQYGISTQELGLKAQELQQQAALQGRSLSIQEAQNLAQNSLERDKVNADNDFRAKQLGLNRDELTMRANQIKEDQRLRGVEIDDTRAYREAEIDARTTQIANEYQRSGQQIDLESARIQAQKDINKADNDAQMSRLQKQLTSQEGIAGSDRSIQQAQLAFQNAARLSEQSGIQYTVDANGQPVVLRDANGQPVRTSQFTQAEEARKQQERLTTLDLNLRRQLGMMEATGNVYTVDPTTGAVVQGAGQTLAGRQFGIQEGNLTGSYGGKLTQEALQNAYARAAQLSQVTGQQYTVDPTTGAIMAGGDTLAARLQQAGITGTFGGALTQSALQDAYARAAQLSQVTGKQYTVDPKTGALTEGANNTYAAQLQAAGLTGQFNGQATLERLQQNLQQAQVLSQITGKQYTVNDRGELVPATASAAQTEQARQFELENKLRQSLGMSEATGYVYDPITGTMKLNAKGEPTETVQGQIARSQILLSLAQSLSGLSPEQIAQLLGQKVTTGSPGGGVTTDPPTTAPPTSQGVTDWSSSLGPTTWGAGKSGEQRVWGGKVWRYDGQQWIDTAGGTTTTTQQQIVTTTTQQQIVTTTPAPTSNYYKVAASGSTVPPETLAQLSGVTNPNPTGVYYSYGKYWRNSGAGWYEIAIDQSTGQWTRV